MEKGSSKKKNDINNNRGLKDDIVNNGAGGRSARTHHSDHHQADYSCLVGDGDLVGGFSWPPRSYTCTFCKREFRSAQALGGHMNVHRRDRARLRQTQNLASSYTTTLLNLNLHPTLAPNPYPNPNPKFSAYLSSSMSLPPPNLISSSPSSSIQPSYCLHPKGTTAPNLTMMKSQIPHGIEFPKLDGFLNEINERKIVRLNLEIGLLGESKSDDLDLELRLGCS